MATYILVDGQPVLEPSMAKWGKWLGNPENKRTARSEVNGHTVSTVFLGLDHGYGSEVVLWETMWLDGEEWQEFKRYSSEADAKRGHEECCEQVRTRAA